MRTSAMFVLFCTFALSIVAAPPVFAQADDNREIGPGVQPDPGYQTRGEIDDVTDTGANLADGTSWAATIVAFLAGLGLGWVIFRRPVSRDDDMIDRDRRVA